MNSDWLESAIRALYGNIGPLDREEVVWLLLGLLARIKAIEDKDET